MLSAYNSPAVLASFDNSAEPPAPAAVPVPAPGRGPAPAQFSQEQVNALLAKDRLKHQAQVQRVEKMLQEVSESKNLSVQEREQFAQELADLRKETQTKEQQLAHEKKQLEEQYGKKLAEAKKSREEWEKRFREGTVERALLDAAVGGDAFNTETMMDVLRPRTRLAEITDEKTGKGTGQFKVLVDFPDNDPNTGEPTVISHTPQSAVKRMKELSKYANLFKSGVISGLGSSSGAGVMQDGKVDPRKIAGNMAEYMKLRETRPELLGLRPNKKGGAKY